MAGGRLGEIYENLKKTRGKIQRDSSDIDPAGTALVGFSCFSHDGQTHQTLGKMYY